LKLRNRFRPRPHAQRQSEQQRQTQFPAPIHRAIVQEAAGPAGILAETRSCGQPLVRAPLVHPAGFTFVI
jgi:hypothetical protein